MRLAKQFLQSALGYLLIDFLTPHFFQIFKFTTLWFSRAQNLVSAILS